MKRNVNTDGIRKENSSPHYQLQTQENRGIIVIFDFCSKQMVI